MKYQADSRYTAAPQPTGHPAPSRDGYPEAPHQEGYPAVPQPNGYPGQEYNQAQHPFSGVPHGTPAQPHIPVRPGAPSGQHPTITNTHAQLAYREDRAPHPPDHRYMPTEAPQGAYDEAKPPRPPYSQNQFQYTANIPPQPPIHHDQQKYESRPPLPSQNRNKAESSARSLRSDYHELNVRGGSTIVHDSPAPGSEINGEISVQSTPRVDFGGGYNQERAGSESESYSDSEYGDQMVEIDCTKGPWRNKMKDYAQTSLGMGKILADGRKKGKKANHKSVQKIEEPTHVNVEVQEEVEERETAREEKKNKRRERRSGRKKGSLWLTGMT